MAKFTILVKCNMRRLKKKKQSRQLQEVLDCALNRAPSR